MAGADALFDAGLDCLGRGQWDEAAGYLRGALRVEPGHVEAAHGLMRALDQGGRGEEALGVARELIAREPEDVLARTGLSMIYQRMGRIEEAEKAGVEAKVLGWKMELRGAGGGEQGLESGVAVDDSKRGFPSDITTAEATATDEAGLTERERAAAGGEVARWFVATTNAGKLRDFALASGGRVRLEVLPGLRGIAAPAEDEDTFEGNAGVKARYYSRFAPGQIVVADDSGLEVDGLGGAPGVRSARYAEDREEGRGIRDQGVTADERNNACLLREMVGVEARSARYRSVLVAARDAVVIGTASGSVEGRILEGPRGSGGFGYDPLFYVEERGCTMAEMDGETRLGLSHRGKALRGLMVGLGFDGSPSMD